MRRLNQLFAVLVSLATLVIVLAFAWLLWEVLAQGFGKISWEFLSQTPRRSGREGGIWPMLVSTLWLLFIAILVAVPLSLACAVWLAEYAKQRSAGLYYFGIALDILAGVPSIVFGLFGYAFFCIYLQLGFSILSGGLTLACMMLPILIRTAEAGIRAIPNDWRLGGAALAVSRFTLLRTVILPSAAPAITAGLLLAVGRAVAETAALIFTSGYVDRMPESMADSGRALAVHIYDLSMNVVGGDEAAYGTALVLITLIIVINVMAKLISGYWFASYARHY